ncbi:GGDEF domain-containing protein [Terrihabitans sp. B22-R8]|uniref:GGDEF domain-containing protein n=1 Tax=Terrihabitans sp. B22-R8 TaxID=3425128 RepID=UPI00403C5FE9
MPPKSEIERSLGFAEAALSVLRRNGELASPRNFSVWYHYTAGTYPELVIAVDNLLARRGHLSEADHEALHLAHIMTPGSGFEAVGSSIYEEADQIIAMIVAARSAVAAYAETFARLQRGETGHSSPEGMISAAQELDQIHGAIERRLRDSRIKILRLQEECESLRHEALVDRQTLLSSRGFFEAALSRMMAEGRQLALLVTDIDHFKSFNDRYGHLTGDEVLKLVASTVKKAVRDSDIAARYGGEEFAIIMPGIALDTAVEIADRLRRLVMERELIERTTGNNLGRVTISVGVATFQSGDDMASLVERADKCLYGAKHAGRNRVVGENDKEARRVTSPAG